MRRVRSFGPLTGIKMHDFKNTSKKACRYFKICEVSYTFFTCIFVKSHIFMPDDGPQDWNTQQILTKLIRFVVFGGNILCIDMWKEKNQLDATRWFIELTNRSTCFGHYYAHLQEFETTQMVTACGTKHFICSWSVVWNGDLGNASGWRDIARLRVEQTFWAVYKFNKPSCTI
jgi:hypothetical protein